ncbi:Glu-tRNA(Gln) amidotransferase subunit GatD [Candidatus Woesearchaeota archaeon]|nr:Glu-tRNA(Gln) amidotransferase subunit GatD [Candidatus Woesearchaeota archaeon]
MAKTTTPKPTATRQAPPQTKPGDRVRVSTTAESIEGILIPRPALLEQDITILKLDTGYNIGIDNKHIKKIEKIGAGVRLEVFPSLKLQQKKGLPAVALIATGGTISSRLDYQTGGVKWLMEPGQLFALVPEIADFVRFKEIRTPFLKSSEDMVPENWQVIAQHCAELLNDDEISGVIVTHGTDTLHYTAAALSFMLKNLSKPVVLTYSQRSTDRASTDTVLNLKSACHMAASDIAEVMLVGHGSSDDTHCLAIRGTKVRKMHTSRRDAFRPINDVPLARVSSDGKIEVLNKTVKKRAATPAKMTLANGFEGRVAIIKYYPGCCPTIIDHYVKQGYKGLVLESVGLGHVAGPDSQNSWMKALTDAIAKGVIVCATAQTIYGRLNPLVYSTGRELQKLGVIYLQDMLTETAYVKLGWVLAQAKDRKDAQKMLLENVAGEINDRIAHQSFLV